MMFKLDLQLFASKKGVGSTKNGRDSESKRLVLKKATDNTAQQVPLSIVNAVQRFTQERIPCVVEMIPSSQPNLVL